MSGIHRFKTVFAKTCGENGIPHEIVCEEPNLFGAVILKRHKPKAQRLSQLVSEAAIANSCHIRVKSIDQGVLFIASRMAINEDTIAMATHFAEQKYNQFYSSLEAALNEPLNEQIKGPTNAKTRASAKTLPTRRNLKVERKLTIDDKIEEALDGIATPEDIQPQAVIKCLLGALRDSGLDRDLKAAGVSWHVAEPGKHLVTFSKGDVHVLQKATIDLADPKTMGETLNSLRSIADGKAPESGTIELEMAKQAAAAAREKESQLTDIATQYVAQLHPPEPEAAAGKPVLK